MPLALERAKQSSGNSTPLKTIQADWFSQTGPFAMTEEVQIPLKMTSNNNDVIQKRLATLSVIYRLGGLVFLGTGAFFSLQVTEAGMLAGGILLIAIACLLLGLCFLMTGFFIKTKKHHTFCYLVAILTCVLLFPLGVILGVFTLILLSRDDVKASFHSKAGSA